MQSPTPCSAYGEGWECDRKSGDQYGFDLWFKLCRAHKKQCVDGITFTKLPPPRKRQNRAIVQGTFRCNTCGVAKDTTDFGADRSSPTGLRSSCKQCSADTQITKLYGASSGDKARLRSFQDNRCAVCDQDLSNCPDWAVHLDHDHSTGAVRGVCCLVCNTHLITGYEALPEARRDSPTLNLYLSDPPYARMIRVSSEV